MYDPTHAALRVSLAQPARRIDVENGYRLFLGREPENEEVVQERSGQLRTDMLFGFLGSDEFLDWARAVIDGAKGLPGYLGAKASSQLRRWASEFFALAPSAGDDQKGDELSITLLLHVLELKLVQDVADRRLGLGGTDQVLEELKLVSIGAEPQASEVPARASDIFHLYLLLLDRLPESADVVRDRLGLPLSDIALAFVSSGEFAARFVEPGLAEWDHLPPLTLEMRGWLRAALGLDLAAQSTRAEALAALLRKEEFRSRLDGKGVAWDIDRFLSRLDATKGGEANSKIADLVPRSILIEESGFVDPEWYRARYVDIRQTGTDPLEHFIHCGLEEGRDPGPRFETAFYREAYPEVADQPLPPFEHYLRIGRWLGWSTCGPAPYHRWLTRFDELSSTDRGRIAHAAKMEPLPPVCIVHIDPPAAARAVEQIGVDPHYRVVSPENLHSALDDLADGTVVIIQAEGACLRDHAVYVFARMLARGEADAAYADHDLIDAAGERSIPIFKPAMSPDLMIRQPYAGPVIALRIDERTRPLAVQCLRDMKAAEADRAFASLLLALPPDRVERVPLPLFSRPGSASEVPPLLRKLHEPSGFGAIEPARPRLIEQPIVTILIPTRDRWELVRDCVDSIFDRSIYPRDRIHVIIIDNDSTEAETLAFLERFRERPRCTVVSSPGPFNFARVCNDGARAAQGDVLVFLNNDTTVIARDWLETLVANAIRSEIGVVGAQLLYPDDTVQHGGVILGYRGVGGHRLIGVPAEEAAAIDVTRQMTAVTGACLAMRRSVFEEVHGFDAVLSVAFNDVDLCVRVTKAGYQNLYVAQPLLYHHESKSRGFDDTRQKVERNAREAMYVRSIHDACFRDDPSYSPNLSLDQAGELAFPPRVVRPWRRDPDRRSILLLSVGLGLGHGVGCVVVQQAEAFARRGWRVTIGGATESVDADENGWRRVKLATPEEAASYAVMQGFDCIIAHTPPFFSLTRFLGERPLFYAYDHGEPPASLFPDADERRGIDWEKRFCVPLAKRVFTISQTIHDAQYRKDAIVLRNGNSHLSSWSSGWAARRDALRVRYGFGDKYVVLNVCRFHKAERSYKGIDDYIDLASDGPYRAPELAGNVEFVLVGRGDPDDVAYVRAAGLTVLANVSDEEMAELYAASDLYVSLSHWEGYNLGIGQALAMGLEVIASDIPAHREFGVEVATTIPQLCDLVAAAFARRDAAAALRKPQVEPWDRPMEALAEIISADVEADLKGRWL